VLDDVQRRRFLVKPARKDPAPALVGLLHVDLDERARQLLRLPRRRRLAGAQAHDHILPADRLTRTQRDVLDDAVALVEDTEDGDALRHRRHAALAIRGLRRLRTFGRRGILLLRAFAARCQGETGQDEWNDCSHFYSGIQGS
jgi:hypothetical protein